MPDVVFGLATNTNQYLHVDSIVQCSIVQNQLLKTLKPAAYWQEEFGVYNNNQLACIPSDFGHNELLRQHLILSMAIKSSWNIYVNVSTCESEGILF